MNQRVKELWIKALKSGEFKQCRGHLAKDDKYCALGVLSVLALLEGVCTFDEVDGVGKFDNRKFSLSFNVMKWADIAQDHERFLDPLEHDVLLILHKRITSIQELNDKGKTFKELAIIIEKYL